MPSENFKLAGGCYCEKLRYELNLESKDEARTSLCHCRNCKKAFGGVYGVTIKVPIKGFKYTSAEEKPTIHCQDNGSGSNVYREFCPTCGSYICEYGEKAKDKFRYITLGSLDNPEELPPKGEFFCKQRASWMPEIPGIFHKQEIKE
ncbi:hypothetical protein GQ43DRAFT_430456 [Delitschia confertaspora ATCC 74209]|uniref:CENP-V/GFA domain-containing protein n=1 Tax=Delitschia confertaspora ATCC 74209 TaxID=1513339 RepID=A0A9P4JNP8_9PLEO|nr:hypothetical protein GQ43DRAFT_430456 [Delitschia confertaspora ATCC 74209]